MKKYNMMKNLLVTLLSDQTIPNVQFIKEKQNEETVFLFVSTSKMEEKGVGKWIQKVCNISAEKLITKIVDEFSLSDIETKLNELNYNDYGRVFVNVTGGTKIMSIQVTDFFKAKENADIYYITGKDCWHFFPESKRYSAPLKDNIGLTEYVESCGFEMKEGSLSGISFEYTQKFLLSFLEISDNERTILKKLRKWRQKKIKSFKINELGGLSDFLCKVEFPTSDDYKTISKSEVEYLTGDWFEEYIYFCMKKENMVSDENLKTGIHLIKCTDKKNIENEFDIIFLWKTKFYAIECKTSILSDKGNIINETIYKSTALQKNLGLFSNFSIFTLSSKDKNDVKKLHFDRAEDLNIKVFCREDILNCQSIAELLKLKSC
ncbi:MAG: DUF1887 family CARF protein [Acholeplasmataceae bacterium]